MTRDPQTWCQSIDISDIVQSINIFLCTLLQRSYWSCSPTEQWQAPRGYQAVRGFWGCEGGGCCRRTQRWVRRGRRCRSCTSPPTHRSRGLILGNSTRDPIHSTNPAETGAMSSSFPRRLQSAGTRRSPRSRQRRSSSVDILESGYQRRAFQRWSECTQWRKGFPGTWSRWTGWCSCPLCRVRRGSQGCQVLSGSMTGSLGDRQEWSSTGGNIHMYCEFV